MQKKHRAGEVTQGLAQLQPGLGLLMLLFFSFQSRYFWKGELEESTEILLVSDHSLITKNPSGKGPQLKGAAGRFGEVWGGWHQPAGFGNIPQGRALEELLAQLWPCWVGAV